jgi:hypothetical protein
MEIKREPTGIEPKALYAGKNCRCCIDAFFPDYEKFE